MQSPFAWAFGWTSGQAGLGEEFRGAQWEMTLLPKKRKSCYPNLHMGDREGTTEVPGVTAAPDMLVSTHQAQGASLVAQR